MWWNQPLWLLLFIFVLLIFRKYALSSTPKSSIADQPTVLGKSQGKLRNFAVLRFIAITAVILALAGTSIFFPSQRSTVAILLDVSGSIDRIEIEEERAAALRWIRAMHSNDRLAVFAFAGQPNLVAPLSSPVEAAALLELADLKAPHPERTDLQAALRVGRAAIRGQWGNRSIILFSDGRSTAGGQNSMIFGEERDIVIDTIPIGHPSRGLLTTSLTLPKVLHEGEPVWLMWAVQSDQSVNVQVNVKVDGRTCAVVPLRISEGNRRIRLEIPAQNAGNHRVELQTFDEKGKLLTKADGGGILKVEGPPQILVVHNSIPSPVGHSLTVQGFRVKEVGADSVPENSGELASTSAMILDNVPATDLTTTQQENIQNYVSSGGGLLVIGGDASLGRGGYFETPLEDILPVQTDTRQRLRFSRANILFIIDHSGSMSDDVGASSKQLAAMKAIVAATKGLNPADEVGILTFSGKPSWALRFTPASKKEEIRDAINHLDAGGGTELNDALEEAIRGFSNRGPVCKHVVLLTDGITGWEGMKELCGKLRAMGATITTIGVGNDVNGPLLSSIAHWGRGKYYRAVKDQLPQIMVRETVRVTRDLIQEGNFSPKIRTDHEALLGLKELPMIRGYILTRPKGISSILLEADGKRHDPLLAVWQYGGGHVAVFTSDSGRRWTSPWMGSPVYNRFWAQLVRAVERVSSNTGFHMTTFIENGWGRFSVDALDAEDRLQTGLQLVGESAEHPGESFHFEETAPGHYEALLPLEGAGLQEFMVRDEQSGQWIVDGLWIPPGLEYRALGPDRGLLSSISHEHGGKILSIHKRCLPDAGWSWEPVSLRFALILLALGAFLVELAMRSITLGQYEMIRSAWAHWRQDLTALFEKVRQSFGDLSAIRPEQDARVNLENQRYMANVGKRKRIRDLTK